MTTKTTAAQLIARSRADAAIVTIDVADLSPDESAIEADLIAACESYGNNEYYEPCVTMYHGDDWTVEITWKGYEP